MGLVARENKEMPTFNWKIAMMVLSLVIRWSIGVGIFNYAFRKYPHFNGPVIDVRELKEMFWNFRRMG